MNGGPAETLLELETVGSTQDVARELVREGRRDILAVRADYQAAGRGRTRGRWLAPPGTCLLVTYILYDRPGRSLDPPILSLAAGLAVAEAIDALSGLPARVKWPNDVLIRGRKAAGVLIERVTAGSDSAAALVGIGLNVNVERFPPHLELTATSLRLESDRVFPIHAVEMAVRHRLLAALASDADDRMERWRKIDVTAGHRFTAHAGGGMITGVAVGVTAEGTLLLRLDSGEVVEVVSATSACPPVEPPTD